METFAARSETGEAGPRERILCRGEEELSDAELLALVLGSGTQGRPVLSVAIQGLRDAGGLRGLAGRGAGELMALKGIGPARAARLLALFALARRLHSLPFAPGFPLRSGRDVFEHYQPLLRDRKREFSRWLTTFRHLLCPASQSLQGE